MLSASIISEALRIMDEKKIKIDVEQLISQDMLKENCEIGAPLCIIAFLPHIYDSSAKERNEYLDILSEASKLIVGKKVIVLWAQGGDFYPLEEKLHLGFGYPAVGVFSFPKKKFSFLKTSFDLPNLKDFASRI